MMPYIMKKTKDDWYPSFPNSRVRLSILRTDDPSGYLVAAEGDDDFGLAKSFETLKSAKDMYNKIKTMEFVNKQDLHDLGFWHW